MIGDVTAWGTGYETAQDGDGDDEGRSGAGGRLSNLVGVAGGPAGNLALTVGLFLLYLVIDRFADALVVIDGDDLDRPVLLVAAMANRWYLFLVAVGLVAAGTVVEGRRLWCGWDSLDHGWALRRFTAAAVVVLVWHYALYDYNYLAGQGHLADRWLVVALGAAAVIRPIGLIPFAVQIHVMAGQFLVPFGTAADRNIEQVLLIVVVAAAAAHLRYVATRRTDTSDAVLVVTAGLAAHFFLPGWSKLRLDWLDHNDLSNLPLGAHSAGWLGGSDGWWADGLAVMLGRFGTVVMILTLVVELAAPLAALRPTLARWWLPLAVLFNLSVFAVLGFWFLAWLTVEVGLLVLLWRDSTRRWLRANADLGRGLVGLAAATVGASLLFHPPGLVWFDAPVSYGYRMEAVGVSGERYNVPAAAFAPLDQEVAFLRLQLGPVQPASGAYGAVATVDDLERLDGVRTPEQLAAVEESLPPPTLTEESEELIRAWLAHANDGWSDRFPMTAPGHFWTSAPDPEYHFDEPIQRLEVFLVAEIHASEADDPAGTGTGEPRRRETSVLVVEAPPPPPADDTPDG